jgi:hypothetical protein
MSDEEKFKRLTITLPPDLLDWVKQKKKELEIADRRVSTSVSAIIADAVAEMRTLDQSGKLEKSEISAQKSSSKPSNVSTSVNAKVVKGSESSVGGFSKATTDRSRKTG